MQGAYQHGRRSGSPPQGRGRWRKRTGTRLHLETRVGVTPAAASSYMASMKRV